MRVNPLKTKQNNHTRAIPISPQSDRLRSALCAWLGNRSWHAKVAIIRKHALQVFSARARDCVRFEGVCGKPHTTVNDSGPIKERLIDSVHLVEKKSISLAS